MTVTDIQTDPTRPSGDRRTVIGCVSFAERNGEIVQVLSRGLDGIRFLLKITVIR